jgi:hypothetical protein
MSLALEYSLLREVVIQYRKVLGDLPDTKRNLKSVKYASEVCVPTSLIRFSDMRTQDCGSKSNMEQHECIFEETAACGEIRQRLKGLEKTQEEIKKQLDKEHEDSRKRFQDLTDVVNKINLQLAEGQGVLKGGKLLAGIIGGAVAWIASLIVPLSKLWENKS